MDELTSTSRAIRRSVAVSAFGVASLLAGLAWDARLHADDPGLASSEGVFTLTNPGHLLGGIGLVLAAIGLARTAWLLWIRPRSGAPRVLGMIGLALVPLLAGGVAAASAVTDEHHTHAADEVHAAADGAHDDPMGLEGSAPNHMHARDYDAHWDAATDEERATATELVENTRAATAIYQDYDAALAAGYVPNAPEGRTPTHFPNRDLMADGKVLDPSAPETLIYWTAPDGTKVLIGVAYKTTKWEDAPAPGGELTAWHTHAGDTTCHPAQDADCPQDTGKMLHVYFFEGVHDPFTEGFAGAAGGRAEFRQAMAALVS